MKRLTVIKRFVAASDLLVKIISGIGMALQAIFMVLLACQIFMRFFFNKPMYGVEEAVTGMVVWFASFGAIAVTNANGHAKSSISFVSCRRNGTNGFSALSTFSVSLSASSSLTAEGGSSRYQS